MSQNDGTKVATTPIPFALCTTHSTKHMPLYTYICMAWHRMACCIYIYTVFILVIIINVRYVFVSRRSPSHSFIHSFLCLFDRSFVGWLVRSLACSFSFILAHISSIRLKFLRSGSFLSFLFGSPYVSFSFNFSNAI